MEGKGLFIVSRVYEFRAVWRLKTDLSYHFRYFLMPVALATKLKSHQIYFQWLSEELVIIYTVLARRL